MRERYEPTTLDEFVGQEEVKAALRPRIQQAITTTRPLPHMLLTSEPGFGKTTLARLLAEQVNDPFHLLDLTQMTDTRIVSFFRRYEGGVLLVDEFHRASSPKQEMLLQLLEEGFLLTPYGAKIEANWLTIIAATTKPDKLDEAVMSRFPVRLKLQPYTTEEMITIISQMADRVEVDISPDEARILALAAGGVPRMARDLVDAYVSLGYVGQRTAEQALQIVGVDEDGLTRDHVAYLRALDKLEGQAGATPLCNLLRCSQGQLFLLERLLLDKRMISMSPRGRVILGKGLNKIKVESEPVGRFRG